MMFYRRRASPNLRDDMTEVEYGGGGHRTRLRNNHEDQLVCPRMPLAPVYKGPKGRGRPAKEGAPRGSPTPTGSRTPFFPSWSRRRGEGGGREEGKGGRRPPLLVLFGLGRGGVRGHLLTPFLFSLRAHEGPITPGRVPVTPRYSGKMPISPRTLPMSKHRLPIYQSLCLDHFETPRHVRNVIRDSEETSVHQNS